MIAHHPCGGLLMAWFWTDDLARALIDEGVVSDDAVQEWIRRPVAVAGASDVDPVAMARSLLGIDPAREGAA
jgi:hypothetical protein